MEIKFSEAKAIIELLQIAGWFKWKGIPEYRKIWKRGDSRYMQIISFEEIASANVPVSYILGRYEKKAARELGYY